MNGITNFIRIVLLTTLLALTACGGNGSGGGGLVTGEFTKTFSPTDDGNNTFPFNGTFDQKIQMLYTAAEIKGSGNISALRFRRSGDTAQETCQNTTIRLGHTSLTVLTTTFGSNVEEGRGSLVTVLNDATVAIPVGSAATWFEIPLATAFNYNGVDNLVVEVERTTACSSHVFTDYTVAPNRRAHSSTTDTTPGVAEHNQTTANGTDDVLSWMQFVFAGGDNAITYTGTQVFRGNPFTDSGGDEHIQSIYPASYINGSGPITGIAFPINSTTGASSFTVTAKLGHFTAPELTSRFFSDNYSDNPVTVVNAATFSVPAGVPTGSYVWLPLNGDTFIYNGADSLVMEIEVSSPSGNIYWGTHTTPSINASLITDVLRELSFDAKFRFNGAAMDVISTGNISDSYPFHSVVNPKRQYLYTGSQLGTAAVITSVACRLSSTGPTVATDYANFEIVLGHSILNTLSANLGNNLEAGTTVFDGTFSMPAGLIKGDWIEIPLTSSFTLDPTKNLVVQMASDSGANGYSCNLESSTDNFHAFTNDRTNLAGFANAFQADLRLGYSK